MPQILEKSFIFIALYLHRENTSRNKLDENNPAKYDKLCEKYCLQNIKANFTLTKTHAIFSQNSHNRKKHCTQHCKKWSPKMFVGVWVLDRSIKNRKSLFDYTYQLVLDIATETNQPMFIKGEKHFDDHHHLDTWHHLNTFEYHKTQNKMQKISYSTIASKNSKCPAQENNTKLHCKNIRLSRTRTFTFWAKPLMEIIHV